MLYKVKYYTIYAGQSGSRHEHPSVYIEGKSFEEVQTKIKNKLETKYQYTTVYFYSIELLEGVLWK